jgi:Peptidogalycan biosysnthesis/recognition
LLPTLSCHKSKLPSAIVTGGYDVTLCEQIKDIEEAWSEAAPMDVLLQIDFLACVEKFAPSGIKPYYGVVTKAGKAVGVIYWQMKYVQLKDNLRNVQSQSQSLMSKAKTNIKDVVISKINFQTLVCGNLMLTGKYGFYFKEKINQNLQFDIVTAATELLSQKLKTIGIHPELVLFKDFFGHDLPENTNYAPYYTRFLVQPKMILPLHPSWDTFDDYTEDLKSKYRVRLRKARGKVALFEIRILEADDIKRHSTIIMQLYKNISDEAEFNAFVLHEEYFGNLKAALGNDMTFTSYWQGNDMIAFYTSIRNVDTLDAHFLGYQPTANKEYQLYLNMLLDLVREGIDKRLKYIDLSRTAVEIKSTIGATPHDMFLFLKHTHPLLNKVTAMILGFVKPSKNYTIRSPFKDA